MTLYVQRDKWLTENGLKGEFDAWLETDSTSPYNYTSVFKKEFPPYWQIFRFIKDHTNPNINPYSGLTTPGVVLEYLKNTYIVIISQLSACNITSILLFSYKYKNRCTAVRVNTITLPKYSVINNKDGGCSRKRRRRSRGKKSRSQR
jgi:hypothetical protein